MKRWLPVLTLAALTMALTGCGEQNPSATGNTAQSATAEDPHAGHNHGPGEGHGEPPAGDAKPGGGTVIKPGKGPWTQLADDKYKVTPSGLTYAIIKEGKDPAVNDGQQAVMHYTGWLQSNGKKFDSSRDRNEPFPFPLGQGMVIRGWDEGVKGMKVGEQRQLVIPSELGYGAQGMGGAIPGGATLIFDVELVGIK